MGPWMAAAVGKQQLGAGRPLWRRLSAGQGNVLRPFRCECSAADYRFKSRGIDFYGIINPKVSQCLMKVLKSVQPDRTSVSIPASKLAE